MKKKKKEEEVVATIKLVAPNGETMIWTTSINHVVGNKVKDLDVAKRNFAHLLVNKFWLNSGKAEKVFYDNENPEATIIKPIASNKNEFFQKRLLMKEEIETLSKQITALRIKNPKKEEKTFF